MALTPAQLATLKTAITNNATWNAFPNNSDGAFDLAKLLNQDASPVVKAWRLIPTSDSVRSFDGSAAAAGIEVSLQDTGTVFGTVTASADADVIKFDGAEGAVASVAGLTLGTSATGYTCTSEGSITVTKNFDVQLIQPTNQYVKQFPLGREPKCIIGNAVRIVVKAAAAVNAICYMVLEF